MPQCEFCGCKVNNDSYEPVGNVYCCDKLDCVTQKERLVEESLKEIENYSDIEEIDGTTLN